MACNERMMGPNPSTPDTREYFLPQLSSGADNPNKRSLQSHRLGFAIDVRHLSDHDRNKRRKKEALRAHQSLLSGSSCGRDRSMVQKRAAGGIGVRKCEGSLSISAL